MVFGLMPGVTITNFLLIFFLKNAASLAEQTMPSKPQPKAVLVNSEGQFLHLSRYIHKQALTLQGDALQLKQPCSYPEYVGERKTQWIHPEEILSYFSKENPILSYRNFVTGIDDNYPLKELTLEE